MIRKTKVWGKGRRKVISFIVTAAQLGKSNAKGVRKNAFICETEGRVLLLAGLHPETLNSSENYR